MNEFKSQMGLMLQQPFKDKQQLLHQSLVSLSFIRDDPDAARTPCWIMVVNIRAIQAIDDPNGQLLIIN